MATQIDKEFINRQLHGDDKMPGIIQQLQTVADLLDAANRQLSLGDKNFATLLVINAGEVHASAGGRIEALRNYISNTILDQQMMQIMFEVRQKFEELQQKINAAFGMISAYPATNLNAIANAVRAIVNQILYALGAVAQRADELLQSTGQIIGEAAKTPIRAANIGIIAIAAVLIILAAGIARGTAGARVQI